ncbi:MAG: PQQ-binding-like beta-propeller repeat protein, partial [Fimbriimonadales bacterium]
MMRIRWFGVWMALAALVWQGSAQNSWQTHRGSNQRTGTTTNAQNSAVNFLLAWTFPPANTVRAPILIDNDTAGAISIVGDWKIPTPQDAAQDPYLDDPDSTQPYRYIECVREPLSGGSPPAVARFTWRSGDLPSGYYRVFVYVPSLPTRISGVPAQYARRARYLVTDGTRTNAEFFVDQTTGGWIPLSNQAFFHNGSTEITVTLTNLTVVDSPDYNLNPQPIVAADAIRFVPDYGVTQASPVAIRSPLDPNNHLVYIANGNGTITCMENPVGTVNARVRWTFTVPNEPEQGAGQIFDDSDSNFTPGTFALLSDLPDQYKSSYHALEPTDIAGNTQRAYWRFQVPNTGEYYVYAWFPSSADNARNAEYTIEHHDGVFRIRIDQRQGGRWVLLNQQSLTMRQGTFYEVSVNNFSPSDVSAGARQVVADAIRIVPAEGLGNGIFSTPAVAQVRVRDGGSTVTRWVVVFGAQNGRVYAVDALGDGQFGTQQGETKLYWSVKPASSTSFSYASPLILEDEDLVVIGNPAGSVYAIDTAHNPNNPDTAIKWEYNVPGAAFVSTPAYDASTNTVYIGSSEGGNQFGRLYALDPTTNNNSLRLRWSYPPQDQDPIEPITATPAVALGRVYINSGGLNGGRIYAIKADNGSLVWARPALSAPLVSLLNFLYSSPLVVPGLDYKRNGDLLNALYVGTLSGRILALDADTGALLHISENLGGALFSSPVYTNVVDTDSDGNTLGAQPAVVVATNSGQLLALHADDFQTDNRKAFEGWDLYSETAFSSPAVLDNWLYFNDDAGITYAYNVLGSASAPSESGLGGAIRTPGQQQTPDGADYSKLRISVTTKKEEADAVLAGQMRPDELDPIYPEALEWGDTIYVVVWNFKQGTSNLPIRVQLIGPGITRVEFTLAPRQTARPPQANPDLNYVAVQSISIQSSGNNFYTPGKGYELQVRYGNGGWTSDLVAETSEVDRPGPNNTIIAGDSGDTDEFTTDAGWRFGIANPLAIQGIGAVGAGGTTANLQNGNEGVSVSTRFLTSLGNSPIGEGTHGTVLRGDFIVRDRRTFQTPFTAPGALNVRAYADDLRWQGGASAVIGLLPWEEPPTTPNRSPDYPDIAARRMGLLVEGGTDLQRAPYRATQTGNTVLVNVDIPRYQPANEVGYNSVARIYVDSNNNGRFDGLENVLVPGVNQGRVEAYRDLNTQVRVQRDPRLVVEEQVLDFGSLPGGFGFNWGILFANHPNSQFRPDALGSLFAPFWKPITVRNEGNINLFPVYLGKAFNSPSGTVSLFGDIVSNNAGLPAWTSVVSTLDPRFFPQPHPRYPAGQPYPILQKPQVNDFSPTVLATPAIPPRRNQNEQYDPPVKPQVSVAIPPFQPMGTYAQRVAPYWDANGGTPGVVGSGEPFATPTMQVVVRVRETQLTGSTNRGVQPMIDPVPAPNTARLSNLMPTAIRNPQTGALHMYWSSNRANPNNPNALFLYKSTLRWNPVLQDGVRVTNGWSPFALTQW